MGCQPSLPAKLVPGARRQRSAHLGHCQQLSGHEFWGVLACRPTRCPYRCRVQVPGAWRSTVLCTSTYLIVVYRFENLNSINLTWMGGNQSRDSGAA